MPQGPFRVPSFNAYIPRQLQPWIYLVFAFCFQLTGGIYGGALQHVMGEMSLMREDVLMIVMCNVVGVNMPFPFLFRLKFRYTNRNLLITAALVIAACNICILHTQSFVLLCILAYISGFFKLCGTFECMSTIQLWMTPKRDFAIFFPLLYSIILGNMSFTPWVTEKLIYFYQDWTVMNWLMIGVMLCIALFLYINTHNFHFMKPLPFISADYLGCILWSLFLIEFIFFFNYGEHYNWLDSNVMRGDLLLIIITFLISVGRMLNIRHPYLAPGAWHYKRLVPLLILFAFVEFMGSTPKVLQTAFTGSILHFGSVTTNVFNLIEWIASVVGCLSCMVWIKVIKQKYTRLLTIGVMAMATYPVMMYFLIDPGLNIEALYTPIFLLAFGNAIFFTTLTIYLEELMPFQHFFMGLTIAGIIRNGTVSTMCSGIYSYGLRHQIAENLSRGLPYDMSGILCISIRQLYGVTCVIAIVAVLIFLLWDIQPVRSTLKKMPYWNHLGRQAKKYLKRHHHPTGEQPAGVPLATTN